MNYLALILSIAFRTQIIIALIASFILITMFIIMLVKVLKDFGVLNKKNKNETNS